MKDHLGSSTKLYVRRGLERVYGLGQAADTACSVLLVDDSLLGHFLNAGNGEWQKILGCGSVSRVDCGAQILDLAAHGTAVVTVVRAAFGILPVPLDGAGDVGHRWLPMVEW